MLLASQLALLYLYTYTLVATMYNTVLGDAASSLGWANPRQLHQDGYII